MNRECLRIEMLTNPDADRVPTRMELKPNCRLLKYSSLSVEPAAYGVLEFPTCKQCMLVSSASVC